MMKAGDDQENLDIEQTRADIANAWHMLLGIGQASSSARGVRFGKETVPFTLITGFLGAGKTTLLNGLLAAPQGRRIAVIVNDFGAINIDAALVNQEGSTASTWQLDNGCVCCTLAAGLLDTLENLLSSETPPDHIVLEASGVAEPMGIIQTALGRQDLRLGGVVCVVDVDAVRDHLDLPAVRPTIERQLRYADLVLLNKIDLGMESDRNSARAWLKQAAPRASVIETSHAQVPADIVLGFSANNIVQTSGLAGHHEDRFASISLTTDRLLEERLIGAFGDAMPAGILRAKGLLRIASDPTHTALFQFVGRRWSLQKGISGLRDGRSSLVLIGPKGGFDADALRAQFDACAI